METETGISVFLKRYVDSYIFHTVNFLNAETGRNTNARRSDKQRFVSESRGKNISETSKQFAISETPKRFPRQSTTDR